MKKTILLVSLMLTILSVIYFLNNFISNNDSISNLDILENKQKELTLDSDNISHRVDDTIEKNKDTVVLSVPFAEQAPYKNWNDPYQEACEEASIIMANAYVKNINVDDLNKDYANNEILNMVEYQIKNWGGHYDLDTKLTKQLLSEFYDVNSTIIKINNYHDIKKIISQNNIIIIPAYGRNLLNPYFTYPGPVYHMLVIVGYDQDNFIVNDPGIWQGKNFLYSFDNLFESIHDLPEMAKYSEKFIKNNPEFIFSGEKNVIVVSK